jgi:hypothetical protein
MLAGKQFDPTMPIHADVLQVWTDGVRPENQPKLRGSSAIYATGDRVLAILAGYDISAELPFDAIAQALEAALASDQTMGESVDFWRMQLFEARALMRWLRGDPAVEQQQDWARAAQHMKLYCEAPPSEDFLPPGVERWRFSDKAWAQFVAQAKRDRPKNDILWSKALDHCMWLYLLAQDAPAAIDMFDRHVKKGRSMTHRGRLGRDVAYEIARAQLTSEPLDRVIQIARAYLRTNLSVEWLGRGQYKTAASWLKLVHGLYLPNASAREVLLLAYEDMPGVKRPEGV